MGKNVEREWGERSIGGTMSGCLFAILFWVAVAMVIVATVRILG
jgi:hypothetical protein